MCVLVLGIVASLLGAHQAGHSLRDAARREFSESSTQAEASVRRELQAHIDMFQSIASFSSATFPPATGSLAYYVDQLRLPHRYPAVQGVGLVERATAASTPALEARLQAEGQPDFHVSAAPEVDDRLIITQFIALSRNPFVPLGVDFTTLGFGDLVSSQSTGLSFLGVSALARFGVPLEAIPPEIGFYVVVPVSDHSPSGADGSGANVGWVVAPIEGQRFLEQVAGSPAALDLTLSVAGLDSAPEELVHLPPTSGQRPDDTLVRQVDFEAGGSTWTLRVLGAGHTHDSAFRTTVQAGGIALSVVLAGALFGRRAARGRTRALSTALARRERWASILLESSLDPLIVATADGGISYANRAACELFADGGPLLDMEGIWARVDPEAIPEVRDRVANLAAAPGSTERLSVRARAGTSRWIYLELAITNLLDDPAVGGLVTAVRDVTEHRHLEAALEHEAQHDPLTGLANRACVFERLQTALATRDGAGLVGVLFIDLDGFKEVNDRHGHAAGDELLRAVAARLGSAVRTVDTVARLGGDEFIVLCEGLTTVDQALAVAAKVDRALTPPIAIGSHDLCVTACIGVAVSPRGAEIEPDTVVSQADEAMYRAKQAGRHRIELAAVDHELTV